MPLIQLVTGCHFGLIEAWEETIQTHSMLHLLCLDIRNRKM